MTTEYKVEKKVLPSDTMPPQQFHARHPWFCVGKKDNVKDAITLCENIRVNDPKRTFRVVRVRTDEVTWRTTVKWKIA